MKRLLVLWLLGGLVASVGAQSANNESLIEAYQREFVFLDNEIRLLKARQAEVRAEGDRRVAEAHKGLEAREAELLSLSSQAAQRAEDLRIADERGQKARDSSDLIRSIVQQGTARLEATGQPAFTGAPDSLAALEHALQGVAASVETAAQVRRVDGEYFLPDGTKTQGPVVYMGRVAAMGAGPHSGALAPAGAGSLKLARADAEGPPALVAGKAPETLGLYLFQGTEKEVDTNVEKTLEDVLEAGGLVGYVILALGAIGLVLGGVRAWTLAGIGRRDPRAVEALMSRIGTRDWEQAQALADAIPGALGRVLQATVRGFRTTPETTEDAIAAAVLAQQPQIDRFRSLITVLAAVAPMLGLLGTVTGMIATFDIITLYGTGDPKLLSGGISEALVTTEFGLMVAIPLLLVGNLLTSWADSINGSLEVHALKVLNLAEEVGA